MTKPKWKANMKHLTTAVERMVSNFAVHAGVPKSVAAGYLEEIARSVREREAYSEKTKEQP